MISLLVKTERDVKEAFPQQEAKYARRLAQKAQEAEFKDLKDYPISLQLSSPGRTPRLKEEYLGDLTFDAFRERRAIGRK